MKSKEEIEKQWEENKRLVKKPLYDLFSQVYSDVDTKIEHDIEWNERRGIKREITLQQLWDVNQPKLNNDEYITQTIVGFKNILDKSNNCSNNDYINYLVSAFAEDVILLFNVDEFDKDSVFIKDIIEPLMAYRIVTKLIKIEMQDEKDEIINEDDLYGKTKMIILESFYNKGEIDWSFAFKQKKDFDTFITILTDFFTGTEYHLCDTISLKSSCKTRLARILKDIYMGLSEDKLRSNKKFFDIVRVLSPYKDDPNLYNTLTK